MLTPDDINAALSKAWPEAGCLCLEIQSDQAVALIETGQGALRPGGFISGPMLFAAADAALWFLAFAAKGRIEPLALTSELSIRFLRPAQGRSVYARAVLNRASRRALVGTVTVWTDDNEDSPCATAQGTYLYPREEDS